MPIGRQNIHMYFRLKDLVNNTMLFGDCSRPLTSPVAAQRLWMTCTRIRMQCYFIKQLRGLLESSRLALLQLGKPFFGTRGISNDVHPSKSIKPSIHVFKVGEGNTFAPFDLFSGLIHLSKELLLRHQRLVLLSFCTFHLRCLAQPRCQPFLIACRKRKPLNVVPKIIHCNTCHNALLFIGFCLQRYE